MSDGGIGQTAQETYWNQLVELKVVTSYVRRYRDEQAWWITRIGLFKAIVTSGTIGAWAIWKDYLVGSRNNIAFAMDQAGFDGDGQQRWCLRKV